MDLTGHNQAVSEAHVRELTQRGCAVLMTLGQNASGAIFCSWDKSRIDADKFANLLVETAIQIRKQYVNDKHIILSE